MGVGAVHAFHAVRHADEFGQLGAMHLVVAHQDVVDQRAGLGHLGQAGGALQLRQFTQDGLQVQPLFRHGLGQAQVATTAKVQFQATENGGGTGQLNGKLANGLACIQSRCRGFSRRHGGVHGVCPYKDAL